jgi:hypothetical protein
MKELYVVVLFIVLISLLLAGTALAANGYQINWWTVDNGGGRSQSADGQYALSGTIGQPDAGSSTGGEYTLNGGFWHGLGAAIQEFLIHLPLVSR